MNEIMYDTIVIGGGPGGSTAGAFLARGKKKVLILERERFPRFHIGESLLPYGNDILKASGAWEKIEKAGFMPKWGAEFCTADQSRFLRFWFGKSIGEKYARTFQVERARFDQVLLQHAADCGCEVQEGCRSTQIEFDPEGATVRYEENGAQKHARSRWIVDATGRDSFTGKQLNLPRKQTQIARRIATYAHFKNVFRNEGQAAGHITIVRLPGGWFWFIPLDEEKTSVGYVQKLDAFKAGGLKPEESFQEIIHRHSELRNRMVHASRLGEFHTTSDYSYRFETFAQSRCLMVGDAAGFVDPIFSSGVMMALKSARNAAQLILKADADGKSLTRSQQKQYTREVCRMMDVYINMICAFYDDTSFEVFMTPSPNPKIQRAIVAIVGGNTELPFHLWWRMKAFYGICRLQRWFRLAPRIHFSDRAIEPQIH